MPALALASLLVITGLILVVIRRIICRRSIKHIRGPASPSFLFGMFRVRGPSVPSILQHVFLGHDEAFGRQVEAFDLESKWMHEFGYTWRTSGAFGVRVQILHSLHFLNAFHTLQTDVLTTADPKVCFLCGQKA